MSAMWDSRLKVSKQHYDMIAKAIRAMIKKEGSERIWEHRKTVQYANDQFISFCWSLYWIAVPSIVRREFNYTDVQIQTALKRILECYKEIK